MKLAKTTGSVLGVVTVIAIATATTAQAATFTVFNTGVDDNNNTLLDNSVDAHYTITSSPDNSDTSSAFVIQNNPAWIANSLTSKWIGAVPNGGSTNVPIGDYTYQTTFDLTGLDASTAVLSGLLSSDNNITSVLINGNSTGITTPFEAFTSFQPFSITDGFVSGINTLEFTVFEGGVVSGFRTEITQSTAEPVPEPTSILGILALGAVGGGSLLKRKQQQINKVNL